MQNSYLFRRGVVMPLTSEAEECMRYNDVDEQTPVRYLEIPDDSLFYALVNLQLFRAINERTKALIDDHEEAVIEPKQYRNVMKAIADVRYKSEAQDPKVQAFLTELSALVEEAANLQRIILFIM